MPTAAEFQELVNNCSSVWTTLNGVRGRLFTSNVNGKTLFLPAAGDWDGTTISGRNTLGFYWSNTYISATNAGYLAFDASGANPSGTNRRRVGFPVRAVCATIPNRSIVSQTLVNEPKEEETPTTEEPKDDNER